MVVILNFCLKVYYFIVISGRGGPHVGGHLFNPPTHRHKRGCLRTPTVLRIKFSKKNHAFPKGHHLCFFLMPFQKKFSKKNHAFPKGHHLCFFLMPFQKKFSKKIFIIFPKATLIIFTITFLKKIQKIFHIFSRRLIVFFYIYILFPIFI